jgi:LysM repeat protein
MARQIYRKGVDIYNAQTNQRISATEWKSGWSGQTDVQDLGQRTTNPSITTNTKTNAAGELINPTPTDVASFNNKYDTTKSPVDKLGGNIISGESYYDQTPTPSATSATSTYVIKAGDNLANIAKSKGTTVAELMKLNPTITNPNLIYAGKSLNLPGGNTGSQVADYSSVASMADANNVINETQTEDANTLAGGNEVPTRKTVDEIMADLTTKVTPKTTKPEADFTDLITNYRSEYGVTALETQLDELRAQEQDLMAQKQARVTAERGKSVAMNVIEGRIGQVEQQENERIGLVQRSIANATNQLNTKYNIINTLMKAEESDYNNAVDKYDKEMANNISIFNAARGIDEANKSEIERQQDNARSNAQIALNAYSEAGTTYDSLSANEQTNLTKMGVQSGLGADFFSNLLKSGSNKAILTTITSSDDTKVTVIYKDGTTKSISTGLPAKKTGGAAPTATESEIKMAYKGFMSDAINQLIKSAPRSDKYLSPQEWNTLRQQWAVSSPYTATDFNDTFRGYVNPLHPKDYAGFEDYMTGFRK